jgi:cyclin D1/2/4
MEERHRD